MIGGEIGEGFGDNCEDEGGDIGEPSLLSHLFHHLPSGRGGDGDVFVDGLCSPSSLRLSGDCTAHCGGPAPDHFGRYPAHPSASAAVRPARRDPDPDPARDTALFLVLLPPQAPAAVAALG